jgi:hypothetical protein
MKKTLNKNSSSKSKTQKNSKNKQVGGAIGSIKSSFPVERESALSKRQKEKLDEIIELYNETISEIHDNYKTKFGNANNTVRENVNKGTESLINHMHKEAIASYKRKEAIASYKRVYSLIETIGNEHIHHSPDIYKIIDKAEAEAEEEARAEATAQKSEARAEAEAPSQKSVARANRNVLVDVNDLFKNGGPPPPRPTAPKPGAKNRPIPPLRSTSLKTGSQYSLPNSPYKPHRNSNAAKTTRF